MPDDDQPKSPDDLFREAVGDVAPLPQDRAEPFKPRRRPVPLNLPTGEEDDDGLGDVDSDTPEFLEFIRPGIQRRLYDELRRGLLPPEASLDLHGMRASDARGALLRFLERSTQQRHRCVRIIHGKGYGSQERQPVLKQKVNQWLRQRADVLAFCSAPRWDGGTGAAYVLLSRKIFVR
jgi:DNA-nicking Smr family endonuclease